MSELSECEKLVVCGNLNAHVGEDADGFGWCMVVMVLVKEIWKENYAGMCRSK